MKRAPFTKDFTFGFSDLKPNAATLCMKWSTIAIQLPITVNNEKKVIERFESAFEKAKKDDWHIYLHAANYCLETGVNTNKGLEWIDKSIAIKETHVNVWEKAELYAEKGDYKNAVTYGQKAVELGKSDANPGRQKHFEDDIAMWKQKPNKNSN